MSLSQQIVIWSVLHSSYQAVPAEQFKENSPLKSEEPAQVADDGRTTKPMLEDPSGVALEPFYGSLRRIDEGNSKTIVRVSHFGDSSIGLDQFPHAIRRRMQARFGDGGSGFVLLYPYSLNTTSQVAQFRGHDHWNVCFIVYQCQKDGHYGYGGHVFSGRPGAYASIATAKDSLGHKASNIELWYATHPHGGKISIQVDDHEAHLIDSRGGKLEDRWFNLQVPLAEHHIKVRSAGGGVVRAYGMVLETQGPGLVWDTMSMIGAFTKRVSLFDSEHMARQVAHRNPDLIVFNYGGNDLRRFVGKSVRTNTFKQEMTDALQRLRNGKPSAACLVIGIIDHARSGQRKVESHHVEAVISAQREVAFQQGCAFFDTYRAMGGPGSITHWRRQKPPLASPDQKHLNRRGRDRMGQMLYDALMSGYERYLTGKQSPLQSPGQWSQQSKVSP